MSEMSCVCVCVCERERERERERGAREICDRDPNGQRREVCERETYRRDRDAGDCERVYERERERERCMREDGTSDLEIQRCICGQVLKIGRGAWLQRQECFGDNARESERDRRDHKCESASEKRHGLRRMRERERDTETKPSERGGERRLCVCVCCMGNFVADIEMAAAGAGAEAGGSNKGVGVNYGTLADNLPSPSQVAHLIQSSTTIAHLKLFNPNPSILLAFAHTSIRFIIGIGNEDLLSLTHPAIAHQWILTNILPYLPATQISAIAVGNEVLASSDPTLVYSLLPAVRNLHSALVSLNLDSRIKISSPHSLGILRSSVPPSSASFNGGWIKEVLPPLLDFLANTSSPFMANAYPFFGYLGGDKSPASLEYALFTSRVGYTDPNTNLHYSNMFDAQLDAVYSAIVAMGYKNIDIMVTETGWPSKGDPYEPGVSLANAQTYNSNLVKHILSNRGTPLRPNRFIETYIFALFNEDLKTGAASERNYGLFKPDMTPVYYTGILKNQTPGGGSPPAGSGGKWCVAKAGAGSVQLQQILDYACGEGGADCSAIQQNRPCFRPNTMQSHASYAMNSYYHKQGGNDFDCFFNNCGVIIYKDPSYGSCVYPSS